MKIHVREGDYSGESLVFDTTETSIPEEASVNSTVTVTYYLKENTYYALSFILMICRKIYNLERLLH